MLGFWGWGDKGLRGGNERESSGLLLIGGIAQGENKPLELPDFFC